MSFDPSDVYDAAALYDLWLNCQGCTQTFDFEPDMPISPGYYHAIGQQARRDGWLITAGQAGHGEDDPYRVLCPGCVASQHLEVSDCQRVSASGQVMEICYALQQFSGAGHEAA